MREPESPFGRAYADELVRFREQCLTEHGARARYHLGAVSLGHGLARWHTATGGIATLHDIGLRVSTRNFQRWPTVLQLEDPIHGGGGVNEGYEVTGFYMWLEHSDEIQVRKSYHMESSLHSSLLHKVYERLVERGRISVIGGGRQANAKDRRRLYGEMRRGATGEYHIVT